MSTSVMKPLGNIERVLIGGDLSKLNESERLDYYKTTCESLGLNPLTKPFDYLHLNGKMVLYAKRDCTDQLRKVHNVSVKIMARESVEGVYVVTAQATMPDGRTDESVGAVPIVREADGKQIPLKPDDRANAFMKCETKAKRRVTLSICGLGMLDESEIDTISNKIHHPEQQVQIEEGIDPALAELLALVDNGKAKDALELIYARMHALGKPGDAAYEARTRQMKSKKQGQQIPFPAVKDCIRGLWADGLSLELARDADTSEAPHTDAAGDEIF